MAWCKGDFGGLGGPVQIVAVPPSVVGRSAHQLAADSLSRCGLRTDRVSAIARRGMPAATCYKRRGDRICSSLVLVSQPYPGIEHWALSPWHA